MHGYKAKQVRDNIHSHDLIAAFEAVAGKPGFGAVYNMGGGPDANCSMLEAIAMCEELAGSTLNWTYSETPRIGDHQWWISDLEVFCKDYPGWRITYGIEATLRDIHDGSVSRWRAR